MSMLIANLDANLVPNSSDGHKSETVSDTAVSLPGLHANTTHVFWTVSGGPVRLRMDGTAPDANTGLYIASGSGGTWKKEVAQKVKLIRATATDAQIDLQPMTY